MKEALQRLKASGVEEPQRELHHLNTHCKKHQLALEPLLVRRCAREPFSYITGEQPFWKLNILVNENVLIPRPETEHVVESALEQLKRFPEGNLQLLDLCTGSGCIAAALAHELPAAQISVVDLSKEALQVAQHNLSFAQARTQLYQGDLFNPVPQHQLFHCITANPPYVAENEWTDLSPEVKCEPRLALLAAEEGLACLKKIIQTAPRFLKSQASLVMECGANQAKHLLHFAQDFPYSEKFAVKDLAGIERVVVLVRE